MRKKWSKALSLALAVSMCASGFPVSAQSGKNVVAAAKKETKTDFEKLFEGKELYKGKKEEKKGYKEGEAVVMYRSTDTKKVSIKKLVGKDIQVVSTCSFLDNASGKNKVSAKSIGNESNGFRVSLVKSDKYTTKQLIAQLSKNEDVMRVEPNYICKVSNTGDYSDAIWALDNKGQNGGKEGEDLNKKALAGENLSEKEKVVAIVDTGVDYTHKDLEKHMWNNPYTDKLKGEHGYDFSYNDADPMDGFGHGTHCAGIIAGRGENNTGVKGVASDANVKIMALRFMDDDGEGSSYGAISAYNYIYEAQKLGVNVVAVNDSWGWSSCNAEDLILEKVMNLVGEKGAVSVVAAGNSQMDHDEEWDTPSNFDSPYIISVAASQENGELTEFSDYGKKSVDLAAPGADILSSVSYDVFTPSIYEDKDALCSYYKDFSEKFEGSYQTMDDENYVETNLSKDKFQYTVVADGEGTVTVDKDTNTYFGKKEDGNGSLRFSVKNAKQGDFYALYIPYDAKKSKEEVYQSFMLREDAPELGSDFEASIMGIFDVPVASGGAINPAESIEQGEGMVTGFYVYGKENYWNHAGYAAANKQKKEGTRAIAFILGVAKDGDYNLYFDDLAVSKENVKSEEFGKYDYYNGTSMAAPYVAGSVALTKALYSNETAAQTRLRIIGSTTRKESMKDKTVTEGVLDLGKLKNPNPVISGGSISADGIVTVEGAFFGQDSKVTVNGNAVEPTSRTDSSISFKAGYNTKLDVKIEKNNYSSEKEFFFVSGKDMKKNGVAENSWTEGSVVSDGDMLYYVTSDGQFYCYDVDNEKAYMEARMLGFDEKAELPVLSSTMVKGATFDQKEIFGEETDTIVVADLYAASNVVSFGKELYTVARLDMGYAEQNALAYFDVKENNWEKVADIPKEYTGAQKITLASYAGKLYLIGGYNTEKEQSLSTVYSYDVAKKAWTKAADLPEGRYAAKAVQTNQKLVVTLGGNENGGCKTNYIFDGTTWTKGGSLEGVMETATYSYSIPYEEGMKETDDIEVDTFWEMAFKKLSYYDAAVGAIDAGVIYTGVKVAGIGNTFTYDLATNTFKNTDVKLTTNDSDDSVFGATIGNKFYVLSGTETSFEDYMEWALFQNKNGVSAKNVQEESGNDYGFGSDADDLIFISSSDVNHKTIEVKEKGTAYQGYINGIGKYEVGDTIKLTAIPGDDYFVKALYVNGKKVANGYTVTATEKLDGMKVYAEYGEYVTGIDMVMQDTIVAGTSKKLVANPLPETAANKKLIWSSSDSSVVKVDQNGKITANANAAGKTATIKVVAADRKKVVATCEVEVIAKVAVKKVTLTASKKTVKAGKTLTIKASVTPKNASDVRVKWSSSKKKYATVNSKGKVTAKKAGKGHTVTITATSVSNPKVKGSIKIKIK